VFKKLGLYIKSMLRRYRFHRMEWSVPNYPPTWNTPRETRVFKTNKRIVKYIAHYTHSQVLNNTMETIKMHRNKLTGTGIQHKGTRTKWQTSNM